MSELEKDFDKVAEEINAKLKEAAKVLKEANKLADDAGLPGLIFTAFTREDVQYQNRRKDEPLDDEELDAEIDELEAKLGKIDTGALESEINQGGWNTSSSYC